MTAIARRSLALLTGIVLLGCSGMQRTPALSLEQQAPRTIAIKLHAAQKLNTDANGRALALVARIYKLRHSGAFEQAPYDAFLSPEKERAAFGADLIEVKEITLIPGQRYEVEEQVARSALFVGVVALFHSPAPQRWRLAFGAPAAEQTGLTIGAHACALSIGTGVPTAVRGARLRSAGRCP